MVPQGDAGFENVSDRTSPLTILPFSFVQVGGTFISHLA